MRGRARFCAGIALASAAIAWIPACTYGPIQEHTRIENLRERFNTHMFAAALHWQRFREPTGLSQFPDGGIRMVLRQAALIYVCDADSSTARLLARIPAPRNMEDGFTPWIVGWGNAELYVSLTGYPMSWIPGASAPSRRKLLYRIGLDGSCVRISALPDLAQHGTAIGIYAPGETMFLRASPSSYDIDVALEPMNYRKGAFTVDQARGTLEPTPPRART